MTKQENPVWFITGCSTGFGRELARLLLEQGFRVAATARDAAKLNDLVKGYESNALALSLDVTDKNAVHAAVAAAQERFGQIDVLVNNAGYGYLAAIEEGEDKPVRQMFETNVFGLVEMTKAVLPGMRARRQGCIVNLSSIGGLVSFAATGYYHATKFAVEGLSGSLATELAPLGIKVLVVEPGPFRTDFAGRSIAASKTEIADYAETAGVRRQQTFARDGKQQGDPMRAAQAIIDAVNAPNTPFHLLLGAPALELARKDLEAKKREFDTWEATTLGADYPEAPASKF
jgi:NADP-dependent 3-hydroxy acid dehydrogenase YdfG